MKKSKQETAAPAQVPAPTGNTAGIKRFAITYLILMSIFFFLIGFTPFQKVVDINGLYTRGVVATTAGLLVGMGLPCTHEGSIIQLPSIALDVKFGCNGLEAVMIYAVAVLAFPASWKKKVLGITAGFFVLQVLNILRIAGLGYSGVHFPSMFEYIHIYIAQGMMIAVALGVFFIYLNYARE
ncbi:MAG: exosortase H [Thermodesulfovibrio sp.]|nr:exosortase H [Thermodesulfovibrio sp.]